MGEVGDIQGVPFAASSLGVAQTENGVAWVEGAWICKVVLPRTTFAAVDCDAL